MKRGLLSGASKSAILNDLATFSFLKEFSLVGGGVPAIGVTGGVSGFGCASGERHPKCMVLEAEFSTAIV